MINLFITCFIILKGLFIAKWKWEKCDKFGKV